MQTDPGDKLLKQSCHTSAAGLLHVLRFYVCMKGRMSEKMKIRKEGWNEGKNKLEKRMKLEKRKQNKKANFISNTAK